MKNDYTGPFIKGYIHQDITVGVGSPATYLSTAPAGTRRVALVIQNTSPTAIVTAVLADSGSAGIRIYPLGTITQDNYNGSVRLNSTEADTIVHLAYANS